MIPSVIAYAGLMGLAPQHGLYAALVPLLALAVHANVVNRRVGLVAKVGTLAVNRDPTLGNQGFRIAPGGDPRLRHQFLNSLLHSLLLPARMTGEILKNYSRRDNVALTIIVRAEGICDLPHTLRVIMSWPRSGITGAAARDSDAVK